MTIQIANTHSIFDPVWAKSIVEERYRDAAALGEELVLYGADLLQRALSSAPDDRGHKILLTVLFRQLLASFDACVVALQNGSEHSLYVQSRLAMESRWALVLGLREPAKWGRHVYVASRRHQRVLLRRAIPGTPEYDAYKAARDLLGSSAAQLPPGGVPQQEEFVAAIDEILQSSDLLQIDALFEEWASAKKGREAYWFYDGPTPKKPHLRTLLDLATEVDCRGEYLSMYSWSSLHVHGGTTMTHYHHDDTVIAIAPIRTPAELRSPYFLAATLTADCFRRVIQTYREGELPQFLKRYAASWRPRLEAIPIIDLTLSAGGGLG